MCHEKYVRYICGCRDVESTLCDLAAEFDYPFWMKLRCPNYSCDHLAPTNACSQRFYCAKSRDAEYLNELWRQGENAMDELNGIIEVERRLMAMLEDARQKNVPDHVCRSHPQFKIMSAELAFRSKFNRRNRLGDECRIMKQCINEVKRFYESCGAPNTPDRVWSQTPSFVDTVGRRIPSSVTSKLIDASRSGTPGRFPEGDHVTVQSRKFAPPVRTAFDRDEAIAQPRERQQPVTNQDIPIKRGRKSVSPAKDEVQEDTLAVRRSARVTKKKVNYGESDGSSPARATSPGESDVSGFAPSNKSDTSGSPERSHPKRKSSRSHLQSQSSGLAGRGLGGHSNSIGSKLNEYRERMSRVPSPANGAVKFETSTMPPRPDEVGESMYQILPGRQSQHGPQAAQIYRNPAVGIILSSRPPTRYGPPNQHRFDIQGINNFAQQPPAMPNFLPSQQLQQSSLQTQIQGFAHVEQSSISQPAGGVGQLEQPVDSTTGAATLREVPAQLDSMPTESPYDRMRRSFSATADLPSPAITDASPPTTDPKKRKQPVSSPLQPSNKRLRLSLPGDVQPTNSTTNSPAVPNQALPMSSPSKMQSQPRSFAPTPAEDEDDPPPVPAPNFAPTAIMYNPSQANVQVEDRSDSLDIYLGLPSSVMQGEGVGFGDEDDDMLFRELTNEEFELPF